MSWLFKTRKLTEIIYCLTSLVLACSSPLPKDVSIAYDQLPEYIDFNFHVRPVLSDRCYQCHGPDENARKAELRLDLPDGVFSVLKRTDNSIVVAGHPGR